MVKTITKIGNSRGLIFDSALLQLAKLKEGDEVNVEVHPGGTITITPLHVSSKGERPDVDAVVDRALKDYSKTLAKLAK